MPESVSDRPSTGTEYVFLLAHPDSGGRYHYDAEAVRKPYSWDPGRWGKKHELEAGRGFV